jgi:hypothetical protein
MIGTKDGPTGEICFDLPSPYEPHSNGLLHLARFIAKCQKHLKDSLPKSYQKNFCRGFDRFLCLHLGIDPQTVLSCVQKANENSVDLDQILSQQLPDNLRVADWNRELVHKGQTEAGQAFLAESLTKMGTPEKIGEIKNVMDMMDFDEGRIPGFSDHLRAAWTASQKAG